MNKFFLVFFLVFSLANAKTIIGKFERVTLPEFSLNNLRAKVDTGAKTSSIHCSYIQKLPNGKVSFILLDEDHKKFIKDIHTVEISRIADVKSSNGRVQKRYFILAKIKFLDKEYLTEFSLTNRGNMKFPILLGRSFLKNDFLVDVTKQYTTSSLEYK